MADSDITIVGLQAIGGVSQIVLSWAVNDPNINGLPYLRFQKAEVQYSLSADMSSPISLGYASTAMADVPVSRGETRYYQARAINLSDQTGEWSAVVSANEISGDVDIVGIAGFWRLPSGLTFEWGNATTDGGGDGVATFERINQSLFHWGGSVSFSPTDDSYSIHEDELSVVGSVWSMNFKVQKTEDGGAVTGAPAAIVTWFAIGLS